MNSQDRDCTDTGVGEALLGNGQFLLALVGVALVVSGGFALFLCITGHFLPHDVAHLGMDAQQLSRVGNKALVNFMFHDRAAFGGSLIAIGILYLWLVGFPLKAGEAWAWWTLAISGILGFGSFLSYLGYGYLDTWHGVATLALLPVYVAGLTRSWKHLRHPNDVKVVWTHQSTAHECKHAEWGRKLYFIYGAGLIAAGATIMTIGMSRVFVKEDLAYIALTRDAICGIAPPLVPIIAHDRAGFGGGLLSIGVTILLLARHAPRSRSFHQAMLLSGATGFGSAIGVHFLIGYTDPVHLSPAFAGAALFFAAWYLSRGRSSVVHDSPEEKVPRLLKA